jgi:dipeptidase E
VTPPRRLVAIGGGGFLLDDPRLVQERYLLSLCAAPSPRVLYLGTAGGDGERGHLKFFRAFTALDCRPRTLSFFPYSMALDYAAAVLEADLVYVGGGNTVAMLAVWREFGFESALRAAYERGTVFAGISAGANCWFERYVTDSVPGGGVRPGLGWMPGAFCPHLDGEAWRQPIVHGLEGRVAAAGEHVMVQYVNEAWHEAVHDAPAGTAHGTLCLRRAAGDAALERIEPRALPEGAGAHAAAHTAAHAAGPAGAADGP